MDHNYFYALLFFLSVWPFELAAEDIKHIDVKAGGLQSVELKIDDGARFGKNSFEGIGGQRRDMKEDEKSKLEDKNIVTACRLMSGFNGIGSAGFVGELVENISNLESGYLNAMVNTGRILGDLAVVSKTPSEGEPSFISNEVYLGDKYGAWGWMREAHDGLGGDAYAKIVWRYSDVKRIDGRIYAAISKYCFGSEYLLDDNINILGLDEQFFLRPLIEINDGVHDFPVDNGVNNLLQERHPHPIGMYGFRHIYRRQLAQPYLLDEIDLNIGDYKARRVSSYFTLYNICWFLFGLVVLQLIIRLFRVFARLQQVRAEHKVEFVSGRR